MLVMQQINSYWEFIKQKINIMLFIGIMSPMTKTIFEIFTEVYLAKNYVDDYKDLTGQY